MPAEEISRWSWWTGDQGWSGIAQSPNPAIAVWFVATMAGWVGVAHGAAQKSTVAGIAQGALIVWAIDELLRGTNPFRRVLGALVFAFQVWRLFV